MLELLGSSFYEVVAAYAAAGLFLCPDASLNELSSLKGSREIDRHFSKKPYRIRPAEATDKQSLVVLERSWPKHLQLAEKAIAARLESPAVTVFLLEFENTPGAVLYTQRVSSEECLAESSFDDLLSLGNVEGPVLQLMGISSSRALLEHELGNVLRDYVAFWSGLHPEIRSIAAVTRCSDFRGQSYQELEEYVFGEQGCHDPIVRFHLLRGAELKGLVAHYRPDDRENLGCGVLVSYSLKKELSSSPHNAPLDKFPEEAEIVEIVCSLLKPEWQEHFNVHTALRDLGYDSLALLELRSALEEISGGKLDEAFFFRATTTAQIVRALTKKAPQSTFQEEQKILPARRNCPNSLAHGSRAQPLAIVGVACRFPGAENFSALWDLLLEERSSVSRLPQDRMPLWEDALNELPLPQAQGASSGGFLETIDRFDCSFFRISPKEAVSMDPQQRILLELAWHALEEAALDPETLRETATGTYIGSFTSDYRTLYDRYMHGLAEEPYYATGTDQAVIAGRIAYALGLRGPALTINTACSSSLSALEVACSHLRSGRTNVALVGAANLIITPDLSVSFAKAGMLSPDGRCKTFDANANGYVRSEGAAVLVVKRLADAQEDGDTIHGIIRSVVVNQDGSSNGLTAPNAEAQKALLQEALAEASLRPEDISFLEAHGTGTALGDPIEVEAIARVYGSRDNQESPLLLSSIKAVIGHTEAAAGLAGVLKALLVLKHRHLPGLPTFSTLNPKIRLPNTTIAVAGTGIGLQVDDKPVRAGVSSFGFSGTNGHVILEQAGDAASRSDERPGNGLLVISAPTEHALSELRSEYTELLERSEPDSDPSDLCHTTQVGRTLARYRLVVTGKTSGELLTKVSSVRFCAPSKLCRPLFLFTGQGSQYVGMTRELFRAEPTYRRALAACAEVLADELPIPLLSVLFGEDEDLHSAVHTTQYTQPALFAIHYALAEMWKSYGVEPAALLGHSVGEFVAAHLAGIFSLEDAARLIAARGRLMQELPSGGGMTAVMKGINEVEKDIAPFSDVSIAAVNGARSTVVSGAQDSLKKLAGIWGEEKVRFQELSVSHAFHSPLMEPMLDEFAACARSVSYGKAALPIYSTVLGRYATEELESPEYWVEHIHKPVLFLPALQQAATSHHVMLELGPRPILTALGRAAQAGGDLPRSVSSSWIASLGTRECDPGSVEDAVAELVRCGSEISLASYARSRRGAKTAAPLYPFDHKKSYWLPIPNLKERGAVPSSYNVIQQKLPEIHNDSAIRRVVLLAATNEDLQRGKKALEAVPVQVDSTLLSNLEEVDPQDRELAVFVCSVGLTSPLSEVEKMSDVIGSLQLLLTHASLKSLPLWALCFEQTLLSAVPGGLEALWRVLCAEHPGRLGSLLIVEGEQTLPSTLFSTVHSVTSCRLTEEGLVHPLLQATTQRDHAQLTLQPNAWYLITGASGFLGKALAKRLVAEGAQNLLLCSRSGAGDKFVSELTELGAKKVKDVRVDVSDAHAVDLLFSDISENDYTLDGIFHAAGVVEDGLFLKQTLHSVSRTLAPKVRGALLLHEKSRAYPLSYFVCMSSTSALFGPVGQSVYAAANGMLDDLCSKRIQQGLPACAVHISYIAGDGGMASHLPESVRTSLRAHGVRFLDVERTLDGIFSALGRNESQTCLAAIEWDRYGRGTSAQEVPSVIRPLIPSFSLDEPASSQQRPLAIFESGASESEKRAAITSLLQRLLTDVLGREGEVDASVGFFDLGFDSHLTLVLRERIEHETGERFSPTLLFEYPTLEALSAALYSRLVESPTEVSKISITSKRTVEESPAIAIVGVGCRFPGQITSLGELSDFLSSGRCAVGEFPQERYDFLTSTLNEGSDPGCVTTRRGSFLKDVFTFDAEFFGIAPREAPHVDPQQRLLLEVSWEALEDACLVASELPKERSGAFIGVGQFDYTRRGLFNGDMTKVSPYDGTGTLACFGPGRLAHLLGLGGPVMAVDTACSSSLVAIHLAVQSLRRGEVDVALAGGVHLVLSPEVTLFLSRMGALSPTGLCKAFDKDADGYGRGEGCGVVVLMRLDDAQRQGLKIQGVILGSAVNHDGTSSGLTVPNPQAQQRLYREAVSDAGLVPHDVAFVEAHGTGTPLGDPIEVRSLAEVYGQGERTSPFVTGSIKNNIGHLEAAAGVAGLLKVLCAFKERRIPGHLFSEPNPLIAEQGLPVVIPKYSIPWEEERRFVAGVSSFGMSGTNGHLIVAEPPVHSTFCSEAAPSLGGGNSALLLSAASPESLSRIAHAYISFLDDKTAEPWNSLCAAAARYRTHFVYRLAVVATSAAEAAQALRLHLEGQAVSQVLRGEKKKTAAPVIEPSGPSLTYADLAPFCKLTEEQDCLAQSVARLYVEGYSFSWPKIFPNARPVELPRYEFQRESYVLDLSITRPSSSSTLLRRRTQIPSLRCEVAEVAVSLKNFPYLRDHVIYSKVVVPGAFYLAALLAVLEERGEGEAIMIKNVLFSQALSLEDEEERIIQLRFERSSLREEKVFISSFTENKLESWVEHATAHIVQRQRTTFSTGDGDQRVLVSRRDFYHSMEDRGIFLGSQFQWITSVKCSKNTIRATLVAPERIPLRAQPVFPSLIDTCFQALLAGDSVEHGVFVPLSIDSLEYCSPHRGEELVLEATREDRSPGQPVSGSLRLATASGREILLMQGVSCNRAPEEKFLRESSDTAPLYQIRWIDAALADPGPKGRRILFLNQSAGDNDLIDHLTSLSNSVYVVTAGTELAITDKQAVINTCQEEQWSVLLRDRQPAFDLIVLSAADKGDDAADAQVYTETFLALTRVLLSLESGPPPEVWCVAEGRGAELVLSNPAAATWWGLCRVAHTEQPTLVLRAVRHDKTNPLLLSRLITSQASETEYGVSDTKLYTPRLRLAEAPPRKVTLGPDETILVTGAFGSLGRGAVHALVSSGSRSFIFLSRRSPGREEKAYIESLKAQGVSVAVCSADVSKSDAVIAAVRDAAKELPPLSGILHTAGVLVDSMLHTAARSQIEQVFAPKISGIRSLYALSEEFSLQFILSFGSSAAVIGPAGQGVYAAANAFLAEFSRKQTGFPTTLVTVEWGPWEAGMAERLDPREKARFLERGIGSIKSEDGFARMLELINAQGAYCVQPFQPQGLAHSYFGRQAPSLLRDLLPQVSQEKTPRPTVESLTGLTAQHRQKRLDQIVKETVRSVIGLSSERSLDDRAGFTSLGMDSLMSVEMRNSLVSRLGIQLPSTLTFQYPTIHDLVNHLSNLFSGAAESGTPKKEGNPLEPSLADLDALSEDELEALLLSELESEH